jgi:hypothetical protein
VSDMDKIAKRIQEIGEEMVASYQPRPDVLLDKQQGIIPRCLIFDQDRDAQGQGSIVVGVNPGTSSEEERKFYRDKGCSYDSVLTFWRDSVRKSSRYYKLLMDFLDQAGFKGPILWTELVKCESRKDTILSIETIRKDINRYLFKEIDEQLLADWPLIAVGRQAYEILAYKFSERQVIGIPHPTSSHGQFAALFPSTKVIEVNAKNKLDELLRSRAPVAVWFSCAKGKGCRAE